MSLGARGTEEMQHMMETGASCGPFDLAMEAVQFELAEANIAPSGRFLAFPGSLRGYQATDWK
jgi:hypothetical protein